MCGCDFVVARGKLESVLISEDMLREWFYCIIIVGLLLLPIREKGHPH